MSTLFPRLGKAITLAAKEGGTDPEMNAKLRLAIQAAKAENMPKDNIENAIKRADHQDMANFVEAFYEGKAPYGVLVYIECATDNTNRTVSNLKAYFSRSGGQIVPSGQLEYMFDRKAVFEFNKIEGMDRDSLELELIDAGLEELEETEEGGFVAYSDYTTFGDMQKALEGLKADVQKASLKRFPKNPVELTDEQMAEIDKLMEKVENDDDVQQVFTNIA